MADRKTLKLSAFLDHFVRNEREDEKILFSHRLRRIKGIRHKDRSGTGAGVDARDKGTLR